MPRANSSSLRCPPCPSGDSVSLFSPQPPLPPSSHPTNPSLFLFFVSTHIPHIYIHIYSIRNKYSVYNIFFFFKTARTFNKRNRTQPIITIVRWDLRYTLLYTPHLVLCCATWALYSHAIKKIPQLSSFWDEAWSGTSRKRERVFSEVESFADWRWVRKDGSRDSRTPNAKSIDDRATSFGDDEWRNVEEKKEENVFEVSCVVLNEKLTTLTLIVSWKWRKKNTA